MSKCGICSKESNKLVARWYQYDNGEQFRTSVCAKCADVHAQLLQTEKGYKNGTRN